MNFADFKCERKGMITLSYRTSTCHWICLLYFIFNPHLSFSHWESNILSFTEKKKEKNPVAPMLKALQLPYQDLFSMGITKKRDQKKTNPERLKTSPRIWTKMVIPRNKVQGKPLSRPEGPTGNWFWMCGQQTIHDWRKRLHLHFSILF